jgi:hypothetical protein
VLKRSLEEMEDWQRILQGSLRKPEEIAQRFGLDKEEVKRVARAFKTQITPYYAGLIKERGDAIWKQIVPDPAELREHTGDTTRSSRTRIPRSRASFIGIPTGCCSSFPTAAPPTAGSARANGRSATRRRSIRATSRRGSSTSATTRRSGTSSSRAAIR